MNKRIRILAQRPWIGYPGSVVQQNYAEELVHGFLMWDLESRNKFDVSFVELPNPRPFITIEWQGSVDETVKLAWRHPAGARFRIRTKEIMTQKDVVQLTSSLRTELNALEVTFKNDHYVNRDVITTGNTTIVKEDLRNPEVLLRLIREFYKDTVISESEWDAVKEQVTSYLRNVLGDDDIVRNTKWSLRDLQWDNTFVYGKGNRINFDQLSGIVGIFGPNRSGKSSIVGTFMYSLFNTTDRGNVKNLHVINVRQPYCYSRAIIVVNGTNYVIERQTVKHESRRGQVHAGTNLNVFRIDESGDAVDLAGEQRNDTEKVIRKLIGGADDCLLTSVAAQDEVKNFIVQGTSKRRKDLSRFLDLDIFDKMFEQAKLDVNVNKGALKSLPDRDWTRLIDEINARIDVLENSNRENDVQRDDTLMKIQEVRTQLAAFKDFTPVTRTQFDQQSALLTSLEDGRNVDIQAIATLDAQLKEKAEKLRKVDEVLSQNDLDELRHRLNSFKELESSFESLRLLHDKDASVLKQQERSLKILDDVPCGDSFPECKFIKDAFKNKEKVEPQRERVTRTAEKLSRVDAALVELKKEGLVDRVAKLEQLKTMRVTLQNDIGRLEVMKDRKVHDVDVALPRLEEARRKLRELSFALESDGNLEAVSLRNDLDQLQRSLKVLDTEKFSYASGVGKLRAEMGRLEEDRQRRLDLLQLMRAHELIAQAFSRKGIPSLIATSQLPIINAEIAKILNGIVNFTVELEQDDDSDFTEVYIDYGDSRRIIELGSGMEKMIASVAIRVALINISSLPKTDMFIIDEGFGALDPGAVEACNRLLVSLKRYFKTIIVITHVEGVKDIADHIIEVQKVENDAQVVYADQRPKVEP